jgi:putative ABC transport system permease protein
MRFGPSVRLQVIGVFPSTTSAILPSPYYMARGKPADFWEPLQRDPKTAPPGLHQLDGIARLRPTVTLAQAADRVATDASQNAFFDRLSERLARDFGPRAATLASDLPIEGGTYGSVGLTNPRFPDGAAHVEKRIVSSNYFDVLKARLVRGRFFQLSDVPGSQPVVVVNETFARLWLDGDPIGQNVAFSWGINGTQTVVGVVADVREGGLEEEPKAAIYISRAQRPHSDMHIIIRTSRSASEVMKLIRASVAGLDAALPVIDVRSANEIIAASARPQQLTSGVIVAFAVSALVLAAIGLYGLISYSLAQRRQELGVRAAIGARPRDLMQLVLEQSLRITMVGIVWGSAAAVAVSRLLSAFGAAL